MFPSERHDETLRTFVSAIRSFEAQHCPGTSGGWYTAEEPTGKRYRPEHYQSVVEMIQRVEAEEKLKPLPIYIDISPYGSQKKITPFLKKADVGRVAPQKPQVCLRLSMNSSSMKLNCCGLRPDRGPSGAAQAGLKGVEAPRWQRHEIPKEALMSKRIRSSRRANWASSERPATSSAPSSR